MGQILSFDDHALARLRARLGAAEDARADLIAFARGHYGAVAAIHEAVLTALSAPDADRLAAIVTRDWPAILAVDCIAFALIIGDEGFRADAMGVGRVEPRLIARALKTVGGAALRQVKRGHPLFGAWAPRVRAEALIRIDCGPALPRGLLLLGQAQSPALDDGPGADLLRFLGDSLAAIIARWLMNPKS